MDKQIKIIISGGGTGGHIFPAISIANALRETNRNIEILFVGAKGRIEMEKVPNAGYQIIGLPVKGFSRKNMLKNINVVFKLLQSMRKAREIIRQFKPHVVVGVGGYASGPVLRAANKKGIPTLIQEQNSYAGITNKILAKKAQNICVAYENMGKYFPVNKIILTGNPVRKDILNIENKSDKAFAHFGLDKNKKTVLVLGGSLGARSINNSILKGVDGFLEKDIQVIWQTGKYYRKRIRKATEGKRDSRLKIYSFITEMNHAYSVADIIVSRAGAGTISELCIVGKPVVLVPSPNVAEDHQTKNSMALVQKQAAIMVKDSEAMEMLVRKTIGLLDNKELLEKIAENIKKLALPNSTKRIADEVMKLAGWKT